MTRNLTVLGMLVLTLPIAVEAPYDTSGHVTRMTVGGGAGYYAIITRDCEGHAIGSQPVHFREAGGDIDQQVVGPVHVGVRGGTVREGTEPSAGGSYARTDYYANPYLSLESRTVGIGGGPIYAKESLPRDAPGFSGHLRFGGRNRYFSTSLMENVPLGSGGGYFDIGIGFHPRPRADWWIGLSGGPFDGAGAAIKSSWQLNPRWTLDASARLGVSGGEPQTGIALGITSRFGQSSGKEPGRREGAP